MKGLGGVGAVVIGALVWLYLDPEGFTAVLHTLLDHAGQLGPVFERVWQALLDAVTRIMEYVGTAAESGGGE